MIVHFGIQNWIPTKEWTVHFPMGKQIVLIAIAQSAYLDILLAIHQWQNGLSSFEERDLSERKVRLCQIL